MPASSLRDADAHGSPRPNPSLASFHAANLPIDNCHYHRRCPGSAVVTPYFGRRRAYLGSIDVSHIRRRNLLGRRLPTLLEKLSNGHVNRHEPIPAAEDFIRQTSPRHHGRECKNRADSGDCNAHSLRRLQVRPQHVIDLHQLYRRSVHFDNGDQHPGARTVVFDDDVLIPNRLLEVIDPEGNVRNGLCEWMPNGLFW